MLLQVPPISRLKGPCQHQAIVPGVPTCDAPYKLYQDVCLKSWGVGGYIGCRPVIKTINEFIIYVFYFS